MKNSKRCGRCRFYMQTADTNARIAWYCTNYFSIFICKMHTHHFRAATACCNHAPTSTVRTANRMKMVHQPCVLCDTSISLSTNFQFQFCSEINWFLIKGNPISKAKYWQCQQQQHSLMRLYPWRVTWQLKFVFSAFGFKIKFTDFRTLCSDRECLYAFSLLWWSSWFVTLLQRKLRKNMRENHSSVIFLWC